MPPLTRRYIFIGIFMLVGICLLCICISAVIASQGCLVSSGLGPLPYWKFPCPR